MGQPVAASVIYQGIATTALPVKVGKEPIREKKAANRMNVEEIRKHIHAELFEENRFPISSQDNLRSIEKVKERIRRETVVRSVCIMKNHGQSDMDIQRMLERKFFLEEQEIEEIFREMNYQGNKTKGKR
ncbi:MAG: hypothetical protein NC420_14370 [Eubacterium sp.]|nr:hypothetical protein [Eubacterium sp.]MCM1241048.1 hypothetical protein [Lachnospiraceae bacterium]